MFKSIFIIGMFCSLSIVILGCAEDRTTPGMISLVQPNNNEVSSPPEPETVAEEDMPEVDDILPSDEEDVPEVDDILPPDEEDVPEVDDILPPDEEDVPEVDDILPDHELRVGDKVVVQNVDKILEDGKPHGLHTRGEPKLGEEFIWGHVFDGAIGTIFDGPIDDGTYTWWRILWNLDDPNVTWVPNVEDKCKNEQCFVWSVESTEGEAVLMKK